MTLLQRMPRVIIRRWDTTRHVKLAARYLLANYNDIRRSQPGITSTQPHKPLTPQLQSRRNTSLPFLFHTLTSCFTFDFPLMQCLPACPLALVAAFRR